LKKQHIVCKKNRGRKMANQVKGVVAQFGTKGYGFITGDDGNKYFVHQKNIYNKSRLKADTRVVFDAEKSEKGLVAVNVSIEGSKVKKSGNGDSSLSDGSIKAMFIILFFTQIIIGYKVFLG